MHLSFSWLKHRPLTKYLAIGTDTLKLYAYIRSKFDTSYFFESLAMPRHQDRYYTLGFDPCLVFQARENCLHIKGKLEAIEKTTGLKNQDSLKITTQNPYEYLKKHFPANHASGYHQGGLIGFFSHEAVNYFEPSLDLPEHPDFANFELGLYTDGLIFDTTTGVLSYYSFAEDRSIEAAKLLEESINYPIPKSLEAIRFLGHSKSREEFIDCVNYTKERIRQGYSFQAETGFKSYYKIQGDKFAIYTTLREINPSPYMFYVQFGQRELLGASPEILINCKQGMILTTPTAGSTRRGKTDEEDRNLARELLNDPKEIAEHNMLVDLHRNDVSLVSRPGSVKVADLMYVIQFSHVQHIVSNVVGLLQADKNAFDVLSAILPGGVVTGAPKIETIKIIAHNEQLPRGPYGGAVGRFSLNGDCQFCLPIRSLFCAGADCYAQTCAGVVYYSNPEKEYAEVIHKLAAMQKTLEKLGA